MTFGIDGTVPVAVSAMDDPVAVYHGTVGIGIFIFFSGPHRVVDDPYVAGGIFGIDAKLDRRIVGESSNQAVMDGNFNSLNR